MVTLTMNTVYEISDDDDFTAEQKADMVSAYLRGAAVAPLSMTDTGIVMTSGSLFNSSVGEEESLLPQ